MKQHLKQLKPTTWPLFRLVQRRRENSPWLVEAFLDDDVLAASGYELVGLGRDASVLEPAEQEELFALLCERVRPPKNASDEDKRVHVEHRQREGALLCRVLVRRYVPPLDLDVAKDDKGKPTVPRAALLAHVAALDAATQPNGLGLASWCTTGGAGAHGDLLAPDAAASTWLLESMVARVRATAAAAGLEVLSAHMKKEGRPDVLLDDTLFLRHASSRGVMWTARGAKRSGGGVKGALGSLVMVKVPFRAQPVPGVDALGERPAATIEEVRAVWAHLDQVKDEKPQAPTVVVSVLSAVRKALPSVGKLLAKCMPGQGRRHFARLALATWLLKLGIPAQAATATLSFASADDPQDAAKSVRSSQARLDAGKPCYGIPRLKQLLGEDAFRLLEGAVERDLRSQGVRSGKLPAWQWPTKPQRHAAKAARQPREEPKAGRVYYPELDPWARNSARKKRGALLHGRCLAANSSFNRVRSRRKALGRVAVCGFAEAHKRCEQCKETFCKHKVLCETNACLHCHAKRQSGIAQWVAAKWPKCWVTVVQIHGGQEYFRCLQRKKFRSYEQDTDPVNARWIYAPGYLAHVSPDAASAENFAAVQLPSELLTNAQECTPAEAAKAITPVLAARVEHLHDLFRTGASAGEQGCAAVVEALAWDEWIGNLKESTATLGAVSAIPWPDSKELRAFLKEERAKAKNEPPVDKELAKKSPCHQAPVEHAVAVGRKVITEWFSFPFSHAQCLRFAMGQRFWYGTMTWPSGRVAKVRWLTDSPETDLGVREGSPALEEAPSG